MGHELNFFNSPLITSIFSFRSIRSRRILQETLPALAIPGSASNILFNSSKFCVTKGELLSRSIRGDVYRGLRGESEVETTAQMRKRENPKP